MRAYLIDPFEKTITEHTYSGDIQEIYALIGADTFDCAQFNEAGDGVFVGGEGLFLQPPEFFVLRGYPQPLVGKGLVIGCDMDTGESRSAQVDREWLLKNVEFIGSSTLGSAVVAEAFLERLES